MTQGLHCCVLLKIQYPPPSPNSHFILHTCICRSGSRAACLEVPLQCSWSQLDAVVSVPSDRPVLCSLCSQARPRSSCQAPRGGERPLKRRAQSASLKCWGLAESPAFPAWCMRVIPACRPQPWQLKAGRAALKAQRDVFNPHSSQQVKVVGELALD